MRRSWLRRKRKVWVILALGLATSWALITALTFALTPAEGRWAAQWASGAIAGCALMMFIAVRESPPGSIERWQDGAFGEAATAKALGKLPPGWEALHDLRRSSLASPSSARRSRL